MGSLLGGVGDASARSLVSRPATVPLPESLLAEGSRVKPPPSVEAPADGDESRLETLRSQGGVVSEKPDSPSTGGGEGAGDPSGTPPENGDDDVCRERG